jgi:alpha-galactosidase
MQVMGWAIEPRNTALELSMTSAPLGSGQRYDLELRNPSREPVAVTRVRLFLDASPERVLEHGWQSWSVVRRCLPSDVRPARGAAEWWLRAQLHADPSLAGQVVCGDQFLVTDTGVVGYLDGRHNFSTVVVRTDPHHVTDAQEAPEASLEAVSLLDGVEIPAGGARRLDPVWLADGEAGSLYSEFVSHWAAECTPRTSAHPPLGWCSWYEFYNHIRPEHVRSNLALAAEHGLGTVQIDDGWQAEIGSWHETAPGWDVRPDTLAAEITAVGCEPGIWTAPFAVAEGARLVREHPEWMVSDPDSGFPLRALFNPVWRGWCSALDTTNPAVLDHIRTTFTDLGEWGYTFHKVDFLHVAAVPGVRAGGRNLTRAEAMTAALQAIRDGVGDDAFVAASGCPLGPAVGLVDSMRVSDDVAQYWEARGSVEGYPEATPAAVNCVSMTALRAPLHRRLWINDPDCVLLRPTGTLLDANERRVITHSVLGAAGLVHLSDDLGRYGPAEWGRVARIAALMADPDGPLDIVDPFATPLTVEGPARRLTIDWERRYSRLSRRDDDAILLP